MIKKLGIVTLFLVILCFMMIGRTLAQTLVAGVTQGNVFTYGFAVFWSSNDSNAPVPESLIDLNRTEWLRVAVTDVSDSMVYLKITYHFENGTENDVDGYVNIETGESVNGFGLVVAPNLAANDVIYPSGTSAPITQTVTRNYSSGERETNRITVNSTDTSGYTYVYDDIYFDKKTGVMLEWYSERVLSSSPNEKSMYQWKIEESNVWIVPEFPSLLTLPFFMITTGIAVIIYRSQRRAPSKEDGSQQDS